MSKDQAKNSEAVAVIPSASPAPTSTLDVMFEVERKLMNRIEWGLTGFYASAAVAITVALQGMTDILFPTPIGMAIVLLLSVVIRGVARGTMRILPWPTSDRTPDVWAMMSDARILTYAQKMEGLVIELARESRDQGIVEKMTRMRGKLGDELKAYRSATRDLRALQRKKVRRKNVPPRMTRSIEDIEKRRTAAEESVQKLIDAYDEMISTYVARRHGKTDGDAAKIVDELLDSVGKKDEAAKEAEKEVETLTEVVT